MAGTMEGLGIPINGGYTAYTSNGTTEYLTTNADGTRDFTYANLGADNMVSITTTNTAALTSGYIISYYTSVTATGGASGGQISAFAADLAYGGTISGTHEVSGAYFYMYESSTALAGVPSIISGVTTYLAAFGIAHQYRSGIACYSSETSTYNAAALDAAFMVKGVGATGTWGSILGSVGTMQPNYFLHISSAPGTDRLVATGGVANVASAATWLKVLIQSTTYYIALHASCTS